MAMNIVDIFETGKKVAELDTSLLSDGDLWTVIEYQITVGRSFSPWVLSRRVPKRPKVISFPASPKRVRRHTKRKQYWRARVIPISKFRRYGETVRRRTEQSYRLHKDIIDPETRRWARGNSLDHRYLVADGFDNEVPPDVMAHPSNLEVITKHANFSKGRRSSISLDDLLDGIFNWEITMSGQNEKEGEGGNGDTHNHIP